MAVLTANELVEIRKQVASSLSEVAYNKATINASLQAVEDWFEANRASIASAIDTAASPFAFTASQKKKLVAYWLLQKFKREGV